MTLGEVRSLDNMTIEEKFTTNFGRPPREKPCFSLYHFEWEKALDDFSIRQAMVFHKYWALCFVISGIYLYLVFKGQEWMKHRKPFNLNRALIAWNWALAIFSLGATIRGVVYLYGDLKMGILRDNFCYITHFRIPQYPGCAGYSAWGWLFMVSKFLEFGDTFFLVVRKKPVIFLHWYHHITVFCFGCYAYANGISAAAIVIPVNGCVHFFMYSYFALRAMHIRVPKPISMALTTLQILQMISFVIIAYFVKDMASTVPNCTFTHFHLRLGLLMVISYLFLFMHFFYKAYLDDRNLEKTRNLGTPEQARQEKLQAPTGFQTLMNFVNSYNECNFDNQQKKED
ncbi:unnamed protein product [Cyprideis torosa]|uniref:Elongation of very long chain fatty acids protein n=1 Tax=Cyprideis torosa TaxID=163714 RepID=A0A7R8WEC5_9CRUS|nr:unnamed protein product [Cyprideis torosa]CAG0890122.1 unnamed protein product [Cyprideis torosa]